MTFATGTAERMIARFAGRLQAATLTRPADSAIDGSDPTAAPTGTGTDYNVEGYSFEYTAADIDETRILRGDYRVILLRSTEVLPQPGDVISIPAPGESSPRTGRVIMVEAVAEAFTSLQVRG